MDREKVINQIDVDIRRAERTGEMLVYVGRKTAKDALALLKEQEAVEPTLIREGRNKYYNYYVCPRCSDEVIYEQNYCSECGVRFMWEGR